MKYGDHDHVYVSECRGQLIWDYVRGDIICSSTGEVVDRIYSYERPMPKEETLERMMLELKKRPKTNTIYNKYKVHMKFYIEAEKIVKNKPWLTVDYEKLFEQKKFVKTINSTSTLRALENIKKLGLEKELKHVINLVKNIDPSILSRTERSKNALAYIILHLIKYKTTPDVKETIKIFNISLTTYRRLEKIAKKIYMKIITVEAVVKR